MRDSMFDDSGAGQKRLEREAEARRNAARRHRDEDAAAQRRVNEAMAETKRIAEEFRAKRELEDERARLVALRRARLTGGIDWQSRGLRVVPAARDGDRVELAASALGELTSLGALDSSPLMFEVELDVADDAVPMDVDGGGGGDDDGGDAADERLAVNRRATHAGVESFTAVEGTIGLPPKTLLSLVRGDGGVAARLERGELRLRVRYVQLRRASECRASLRPRRDGFFAGGAESADVDLKAVLEAELGRGRHTTLSRGDWLSVRHDGRTVHLVVEQLDPDDALCIVSTDLEVDVLPSESVDDAAKRVAAAAVAAAAQLEHRAAHAAQCRAELAAPPPAAAGAAVRVLLRFSDGARVTEALDAAAPLRRLVAHVDLKCCESDAVCAPESDALDWTVRTTFPARCFSRAQLAANGATLRSLGLDDAPSVALLVEAGGVVADADDDAAPPRADDVLAEATAFAAAEARRTDLNEQPTEAAADDSVLAPLSGTELTDCFESLVAAGVARPAAAQAAQKHGAQLRELAAMGFGDDAPAAIKYLDRYGGRLLRVVNALSDDRQAAFAEERRPPAAAPTAATTATAAPRQPAGAQLDPHAQFKAAFARLVAQGVPANEAAARALAEVAAPPAAAPTAPRPQPAAGRETWPEQRETLRAMGFDASSAETLLLLDRYQGRLDRVINSLAGS